MLPVTTHSIDLQIDASSQAIEEAIVKCYYVCIRKIASDATKSFSSSVAVTSDRILVVGCLAIV
jgi:hypothetical protein